jgi:hypothetical protein
MGKNYSYLFFCKVMVKGLMLFSLIAFLSGCSKSTPACDDKNTVEAVMNEATDILMEDINSVASIGGGELSEGEKRMFKAGMQVDVENIRQKGIDEKTGTYNCAADLVVRRASGVESMPVTYTSSLIKGNVQVKLSGL